MNKDPICLSPSDNVEDAASVMISCHMDHIPIVKGNELLGILTPTDLLAEVERKASGIPVEELALSPCVPIYEDASLRVAFTTFRVGRVNALPALGENGKLVGILTDRDLFNKSIVNGSVARSDLGIGGDEDEWSWEGLRNVMKLWYEVSNIRSAQR